MKSDIDGLMQARNLDALFITDDEGYSDIRAYMTNGADITGSFVVKKHGEEPILIVSGMETEEAKKSGYEVKSTGDLGYYDLLQEQDTPEMAKILFWSTCLEAAGIESGRIGIYGRGDIHSAIELVTMAREHYDRYEFVGEAGRNLFDEAFLTKDAAEMARIRSVATRTHEVIEAAWNFIAGHQADDDETVVDADGKPLTIGAVKRFIRLELMKRELEDTGMIFAQGSDAGHPHSRGESDMALKLGQSIVFDLFPRELGGGYHHDMTRTWCIGYAPENVQKAYDEVMEAFDRALESFGIGKATYTMQEAVQDYFEDLGHPTLRTDSAAKKGYVHSLGHGVGLKIHERPSISHIRKDDVWQAGNVVTIEPGLYYPKDGYGVRIEDMFIVTDKGELISITPFQKDLVLPLNGS